MLTKYRGVILGLAYADVLELREIFVRPEDYANPIEPSHIGGEKLAKAIQKWVSNA